MTKSITYIFVCEHGAAKSVVAAAHFNQLARAKGINIQAFARGTTPDEELSPKAITGLKEDGLTPSEIKPIPLSKEDLEQASQIISFCELPSEYHITIPIHQWMDVPPVSENYQTARDTILGHLHQLLNDITKEK